MIDEPLPPNVNKYVAEGNHYATSDEVLFKHDLRECRRIIRQCDRATPLMDIWIVETDARIMPTTRSTGK